MKKILVAVATLFVQLSYSMSYLSPEGQAAAEMLNHATFILNENEALAEIKLTENDKTRQYREQTENIIKAKLTEFYNGIIDLTQPIRLECVDAFTSIFRRYHFGDPLFSCFIRNVTENYLLEINPLLSPTKEHQDGIRAILSSSLETYVGDMMLHIEACEPPKSQLEDLLLKYNADNLTFFSDEGPPELLELFRAKYDPRIPGIKIITAESIFAGFEKLRLLENEKIEYYRRLMIQNPETDGELLRRYSELLNQSVFRGSAVLSKDNYCVFFNRGVDIASYKSNVMQLIYAALAEQIVPIRQVLVLFLAAHEYVCKKCLEKNIDRTLIFDDLPAAGPCVEFPTFSVNMPLRLRFFTFAVVRATNAVTCQQTARRAVDAFMHELRHGIHVVLGLTESDPEYAETYRNHPFMKDLLFKDYDLVFEDIEGQLGSIMSGLQPEVVPQFIEEVKSYFSLPDQGPEEESIEYLAKHVSLGILDWLWLEKEEVFNIIGVQLGPDKSIIVDRLSDFDVYLAEGCPPPWTHMSDQKKTNSATNPAARGFIDRVQALCLPSPGTAVYMPTPEALAALRVLHGLPTH
ncbi:MAG: hypothetical protein LBS14_01705 [Holosporaceae bacterium]|nr:hypothetical protein [Holosporaceae bacterium]